MTIETSLTYNILSSRNLNGNPNITKTIQLKISNNNAMYIIHRALIQQLYNDKCRKANTKTRSEVQGGGRKPWKQKGTGRARAGSNRSPLWRGGGIIFGPRTKLYQHKINKKEKQLALRTLLANKWKYTYVIDNIDNQTNQPHTKTIIKQLNNLTIHTKNNHQILIIVVDKTPNLYLSVRNISNIDLISVKQLNILALLKAKQLIITEEALKQMYEIYKK